MPKNKTPRSEPTHTQDFPPPVEGRCHLWRRPIDGAERGGYLILPEQRCDDEGCERDHVHVRYEFSAASQALHAATLGPVS